MRDRIVAFDWFSRGSRIVLGSGPFDVASMEIGPGLLVVPDEPSGVKAEQVYEVIDRYLPTVLTGLNELNRAIGGLDPSDMTRMQVATRAAYSAAHGIAKDVTVLRGGRYIGDDDSEAYDLPSVLDYMEQFEKLGGWDALHALSVTCRTCGGVNRTTVDMICQTCGKDFLNRTALDWQQAMLGAQNETDALMEELVEAFAEELFSHPDNTWSDPLPDEEREKWRDQVRGIITAVRNRMKEGS
jgi:hypothetical protein